MMHLISWEALVRVFEHLVAGVSINETARLTGVSKPTILRYLLKVGEGCRRLHNRVMRNLHIRLVECDELWGFVFKKQRRVTLSDPLHWGDAYTFVALDVHSRLVLAFRVGKRDQPNTDAFISDLRCRLLDVPDIATDGFPCYERSIKKYFGYSVNYGQVKKDYRQKLQLDDEVRYEPPRDPFITKTTIIGAPTHISTSLVEAQNRGIRMHVRRLTRLCDGYSKKLENLSASMALHFCFYNFTKVHSTLRVTPAMERQLTDHVWSIGELLGVAMAEPLAPPPEPQPLAWPEGYEGRVHQLPNGGWLRGVPNETGSGQPSRRARGPKAGQLPLFPPPNKPA